MIRVCYRCKIMMGEKEPFEDKSETHGLCDPCFALEKKDIEAALQRLKDAGWTNRQESEE